MSYFFLTLINNLLRNKKLKSIDICDNTFLLNQSNWPIFIYFTLFIYFNFFALMISIVTPIEFIETRVLFNKALKFIKINYNIYKKQNQMIKFDGLTILNS